MAAVVMARNAPLYLNLWRESLMEPRRRIPRLFKETFWSGSSRTATGLRTPSST